MYRHAIILIGMGVVVASWVTAGERQQPDKVAMFMRAKLDHAQQVLEGLTTDDLRDVAKHAQELSLLSQAASWQVLQTEEYLQHSVEFRRAADDLTEAAKRQNLDSAALAYVDMTLKCINCHKYVRGVRMADLDVPLPLEPPATVQASR